MITNPAAVFFVLAVVVLLSIVLEERSRVARALGSVLLAIVFAAVLANAGLLPASSPAYDAVGGLGVSAAIALILLGIDVRSVLRAGPQMLAAFVLGAAGTALGAVGGWLVFRGAIGAESWKLAGQLTGTYTGGGLNMVAVGRELETSPELFSAAVAADNLTTTIWMIACLGAPALLARFWPAHLRGAELKASGSAASVSTTDFVTSGRAVTIRDLASLATLSGGTIWLSGLLAEVMPMVPQVLWLTTIALALAQTPPVRALAGGPVIGNLILQVFLASLGAQSIVAEIFRVGPAVFYFTLVVVASHALLLFGVGRALRLDLPTLAVASQANVGGPPTAMALASTKGYTDRLIPGVAVGLLGYAVGNYLGFAVAAVLG